MDIFQKNYPDYMILLIKQRIVICSLYKWIDKHDMLAHRMGRLLKFKINQVDLWIEGGGADGSQVRGGALSKKKTHD